MKVFGKNKNSLERESSIQQTNLVQSKMRSLLAESNMNDADCAKEDNLEALAVKT